MIIETSRNSTPETIQLTVESPDPAEQLPAWGEPYDKIPGLVRSTEHICPSCGESSAILFPGPGTKIKCRSLIVAFTPFKGGYYEGAATVECPICKNKFLYLMRRNLPSLLHFYDQARINAQAS